MQNKKKLYKRQVLSCFPQRQIQKDITPHTLRHSFAAHLLESGADVKTIKEMLGHSDVASTQVYSGLLKASIADVYKHAHPYAET